MKVIVAVILALGSVSALGSGPYLPSGWRPQGPAFYLPNEPKPEDNPLKEVILVETEASGSESLREYGPPKEVSEVVVNQGLPDVATEQNFYEAEQKSANVVEETVEAEENAELKSEVVENEVQAVTEVVATVVEEVTPAEEVTPYEEVREVEVRAQEVEVPEVTTASYEVIVVDTTAANIEEKLEQVVVAEEKVVEEAKSVVEAIVSLENEVKVEEIKSVEAAAEIKVNQEGSGSSVPEGFLEYGPPGFREYGPPKGDELLRAAVDSVNSFEYTNEARRRRFSPKFRSQKPKRSH